jgi:hypothetical protein
MRFRFFWALPLLLLLAACDPTAPAPGNHVLEPWPVVREDARLGGASAETVRAWDDAVYASDNRELIKLRDREWATLELKAMRGIEMHDPIEQATRRERLEEFDTALELL